MQAAKPLRKKGIKRERSHLQREQIGICRPLPNTEGDGGTFFAGANTQYITFRAGAGNE
jgi:hypothetical protein